MMKILFSPSQSKNIPQDMCDCADSIESIKNTESAKAFNVPYAITSHRAIESYLDFLRNASDTEIANIFGHKTLASKQDIKHLALCQNCLSSPRLEAISLYNGVAYKALDFHTLSAQAQDFIRTHLYIFSNLFGVVRADVALPFYHLYQGRGKGAFALKALYKDISLRIDEVLRGCEVLDLRAEAYINVYKPMDCKSYYQVIFLKNGKKLSHYAKYYRGLYARHIAMSQIRALKDLEYLHIDSLTLRECIYKENATILTYEIHS